MVVVCLDLMNRPRHMSSLKDTLEQRCKQGCYRMGEWGKIFEWLPLFFLFIVFQCKLHMDSYVETMWFIIGLSWDGDDA